MFSLLVLSFVLSSPSAAAQTAVGSSGPQVSPALPLVLVQPDTPVINVEVTVKSFDAMEIQPDSDICFKIRTYIFSQGSNPKLLRETTCGPKRGALKSIEGAKPKLVPIEAEDKPAEAPKR